MEAVENLVTLARSRDPADRARLLDAVVAVCEICDELGRALPPALHRTLEAIFLRLVAEAEHDIRRRLAEKLADAAWAPAPLVTALAHDDIEIASPVIAASPVLREQDLIEILLRATLEHQLAVARRADLGEPVVEAILDQADPAVMTALAGNDTARISHDGLERLVDMAREVAALRSPLARHPRLSAELAVGLYEWVGQSLQSALAERFSIDEVALARVIQETSLEASRGALVWTAEDGWRMKRTVDTDRILVAKLHAAGQLRVGYLIRALRERRLNLFIEATAALGRLDTGHLRKAIDSDKPELLALACVSVGIDRSAFPDILRLVRACNEGRPGGGEEGLRRATGAFGPFDIGAAGSAFKQALGAR